LVVGGLVSLFVVVLLLFWRVSRKPQAAPPAPSQTPGGSPPQIVVPPPSQPVALSLEFTAESGQRIRFVLDKPTLTIGRAHDNDIVLAAPILNADTASQHHAAAAIRMISSCATSAPEWSGSERTADDRESVARR
jgi:hypothetical protein